MKIAIISDLHANIAAVKAVFDDIRQQDISRIICLGDIVGYGPDPVGVLTLAMETCDVCIMGNHEEALLNGAANFTPRARIAIDWTRNMVLANPDDTSENNESRRQFIEEMDACYHEDDFMCTHGSPLQCIRDYVMPRDAFNRQKMTEIFKRMGDCRLCFVGHTHQPGAFTPDGYFHHQELRDTLTCANGDKLLINVGSVGQPRDGNAMACYVTLEDGDCIRWHRVRYEIEQTRSRIHDIPDLDDSLGDRLMEGR